VTLLKNFSWIFLALEEGMDLEVKRTSLECWIPARTRNCRFIPLSLQTSIRKDASEARTDLHNDSLLYDTEGGKGQNGFRVARGGH
jgi:hypothetical protein